MYIPIFAILLLFEIILMSVDKALIENNFSLHDYEGFAMGLILAIRLLFWINMMVLLGKLLLEILENGGNPLIEKFVKYLAWVSSFYILGLSGTVLLTNMIIPDYYKQKFTGICILALQFMAIAGFLIMLTDRNSLYNRIRIKKKSLRNLPVSMKSE